MRSFLRNWFARRPHGRRKVRSRGLQVEALGARIMPAVTIPLVSLREQLRDFIAFRDIQADTTRFAPLLGLGAGGGVGVGAPSDPQMPANLGNPSSVLVYDVDPQGKSVPTKIFTITNNNDFTIYPVLRDSNSTKSNTDGQALYDPFDKMNQEYRGYIGYKNTTDGKYYFGLPKGKTISIKVPLALWDGARMGIITDPAYLAPVKLVDGKEVQTGPNPYHFHLINPPQAPERVGEATDRVIVPALETTKTITGAVVTKVGSGYTSMPDVLISGGGGLGATAKANISGGIVTEIIITNPGNGYVSNPTISITGGGGKDAEAIAARGPIIPSDPNGAVMWYHSTYLEAPAPDAPDQLTEWTIRDAYLGDATANPTFPTASQIAQSEKHALINYDVSYVDGMFLPAGMEALNVPHPVEPPADQGGHGGRPYVLYPEPYAWIGTNQSTDTMQAKIKAFINPATSGLGNYFRDANGTVQAWPYYLIPGDLKKIPAGSNIFANSPLTDQRSSYDQNAYLLSTGGVGPIQTNTGGDITVLSSGSYVLVNEIPDNPLSNIKKGYIVKGNKGEGAGDSPIQDGTTVDHVEINTKGASKVFLSKPLKAGTDTKDCSYSFIRPVDDYAGNAIRNLWYSWAKYYAEHNTGQNTSITNGGFTALGSRDLRFNAAVTGLVPGTAVSGPGIPQGTTVFEYTRPMYITMNSGGSNYGAPPIVEFHGGGGTGASGIAQISGGAVTGVLITSSGSGYTSAPSLVFAGGGGTGAGATVVLDAPNTGVLLSLVATSTQPAQTYNFTKPQFSTLLGSAEALPHTYPIVFTSANMPGEKQNPEIFSQKVYQVMSEMSTIPLKTGPNVPPDSFQLMDNVIGFNIGKVFEAQTPVINAATDVAKSINAQHRDVLKSIMRGVTDFTKFSDPTGWYPNPADGAGGKDFNVFNLDPFVRFVHVNLKMSGYGFSVDDDTADVGADYSTQFAIAVGSKRINNKDVLVNLPNQDEWVPGAPYGTVKDVLVTFDPARATDPKWLGKEIFDVPDDVYFKFRADDPSNSTFGAFVSGPGVPRGTRIEAQGNTLAHSFVLTNKLTIAKGTYKLTFSGELLT